MSVSFIQNNDVQCQHKCSYWYLLKDVHISFYNLLTLDFNLLLALTRQSPHFILLVLHLVFYTESHKALGLPNVNL